MNRKIKGITKKGMQLLEGHAWKGNIRELKNVIERAVILENSEYLTKEVLPYDIQSQLETPTNSFDLSAMEKQHIQKVLQHCNGNKTETARLLNIGLTTLYRKIEEYKL